MTYKSDKHFLATAAKRLIRRWANDYGEDPEYLLRQRDVADLTPGEREKVFSAMWEIASALRQAFETQDGYDRDWFLFMARYANAVYAAPFGPQFARLPGIVPMAKDTDLDRAISFVQAQLANKMAVCKRDECQRQCYFRTRKGQKYCSSRCSRIVNLADKRRWFSAVGSERRKQLTAK